MSGSESYIGRRLERIEREFIAALRLHTLLNRQLLRRGEIISGKRLLEDIPVRAGWAMDIFDYPQADDPSAPQDYRNRYGDSLSTPIMVKFWPDSDNDVSPSPDYYDGPKLAFVVAPNGVLDDFEHSYLSSEEIDALHADLVTVLEASGE